MARHLSPNEVYLLGTLETNSCEKNVIGRWSAPSQAMAGFDCELDTTMASVRRSTGGFCTRTRATVPFANSTATRAPPRPTIRWVRSTTTRSCRRRLVARRSSTSRSCQRAGCFIIDADETPWYDEDGHPVYSDSRDSLRHLGYGDWALTQAGNIVDLAKSVTSPSTGLPPLDFVIAVRAFPAGGFALMTAPNDDPRLSTNAISGRSIAAASASSTVLARSSSWRGVSAAAKR